MHVDQRVVAVFSHLLDLLQEVRLEGQLARQHEVQDDAQTEYVDLFVVSLLPVDFRGQEPRRSCEFFGKRQFIQFVLVDCEAEVNELDLLHALLLVVHDHLH